MGKAPHQHPIFGPALLSFWDEQYYKQGKDKKPMSVEGARFRHSWAGWCARKIEYSIRQAEGEEFDTPAIPVADRWRMEVGTIVHDYWQAAIQHVFPNAEIEHKTSFSDSAEKGLMTAGHGDCLITDPKLGKIAVELKSRNGFGYKADVGWKGTDPQGPAESAVRQGALNAHYEDADILVIVHVSLEAMAAWALPGDQKGNNYSPMRMTAEWWYPREEYEPIALHELQRIEAIIGMVDKKAHAPRSMPELPAGARITDIEKSQWTLEVDGQITETGQIWGGKACPDYCQFFKECQQDGP